LTIKLSGPSTYDNFSDAVYISAPNPAELGLFFYDSSTSSSYSGYPGNSIMAAVYDFPAQTSVSIYLGSVLVGTVTTDSNGFAQLPSTATLPAMPAGSYYPTAVASTLGLYVKAPLFTVNAFFEIIDPSGAVVTSSEYVPNTGNLTVSAFGLTPQTPYNITDGFPETTGYASYSVGYVEPDVVSISVGTALGYPYYAFVPASNGTLIFTYKAAYSLYNSNGEDPLPTGTPSTIAVLTLSGSAVSAASGSDSYKAVGPVSITYPKSYNIYYQGEKTQTVTVSNIIPSGATAFYPGISNVYSMYLGSQLITLSNGNNYFTSSTSSGLTATVTFNVPSSFPNGLTNESVVYYKQPVSAAIATLPVVVSSPGTSLSSGFLITVPIYKSGVLSGYEIIGYGLDPSATFSLYYMTYSGVSSSITPSVGASSGAFAYNLILPYEPAGTYAVFLTATLGTSTNTFYSSYTVMASLNVASVTYNLINLPVGYINSPVYVSASGLQPNTYYDVYFAGMHETTLESDSSGTITAPSSPSYTFEIPLIAPGTYNVTLNPTGTSTSVASAKLVVSNPPNVVINGGLSNLAFPTQLITFSWEPSTPPKLPSTAYSSIPVTVYLNGTAYTTVLATYGTVDGHTYLNGSFAMPNDASGSYWGVSFGWSQTSSYKSTLGGSAISFQQSSYTGKNVTYMQLYSGAGALVTISPSQVATIIAAGLHQALQVPLSELNATIASINGTAVKLSTSVGTLTTTLSAINANVTSIMKGQAVLSTDLGNMEVSLQSINASIAVVNGGIVTLQTSLGTVQTTLNNLAPVIMDINGSVMTIGTTVGNINMNLTAFRNMAITAIHNGTATVVGSINGLNATMQSSLSAINAKLVAVNGNIATVQTSLGTVQTSLNSLNATVTSINGNVATVQTSLGTLSGTVTSINNGVATIQTSLGTLQTSVNGVNSKVGTVSSSVGNTMIFEVVVLILVLITLVLAGLAMNSSNKLCRYLSVNSMQL
jgi:prefoldin subunit 5